MMTRTLVILAATAVAAVAILLHTASRGLPEETATNSAHSAFTIAPLDEASIQFLLNRDTDWTGEEKTETALAYFLQAAGIAPSVQNLTNALSSPTRKYRWSDPYTWLRPSRARGRTVLADVKEVLHDTHEALSPRGPTLLVSEDGQLALLWFTADMVRVFENTTQGMREVVYRRNVEDSESYGMRSEHDIAGGAEAGLLAMGTGPQSEAVKAELAQLQGEWLLMSGASYGRPLPGPGPQVHIIIKGTELITMSEGETIMRERFSIDPSKTPKTIDRELIARSPTIIRRLGIYEVDGDIFTFCEFGVGSSNRPAFFTGRDAFLKIYRRKDDAAAEK